LAVSGLTIANEPPTTIIKSLTLMRREQTPEVIGYLVALLASKMPEK